MTDFFDLPDDAISKGKGTTGAKKSDPNVYDPDPNAYNGSYKSVMRFIPYIHDKSKSKYTKYSAKFWNPLTKEALIIDCPSNVEKPSILWTIESVVRGLKKEEPEMAEEIGKCFSRWYTHHSPVYIKKDPQRPDLEGKILFFKFRNQVDQIIDQQLHPEELDGLDAVKKINPYHLLEGKDFLCVVGKKTKEFRDWSKCKFMDEVTPFVFKVGDKAVQVKNDEKAIKLVNEFLVKNTPKLDDYLHQEWTDETFEKVAEAIVAAIPQRQILDLVLSKSKDQKMNDLIKSKLKPGKSNNPIKKEDPLEFGLETPPSTATFDPTHKKDAVEVESSSSDEYDDLFKDL
jgi:hypothetical protein